ncbi:hypothetical protein MAINES_00270 [Brevundimonas phage vB_BpoS-MaInes]|nr:hypothetical protein MAINES_00270 [Brevundimonas phage vB_BpoS-MaInes]
MIWWIVGVVLVAVIGVAYAIVVDIMTIENEDMDG